MRPRTSPPRATKRATPPTTPVRHRTRRPPSADATVVRIGYAFPDLAAFAVLNEEFAIGDPQIQAEAVVDMWRREGMLPEGIEVELVFAAYNILSTEDKLGVCTSMAEDEDVFVVVSGLQFTVGRSVWRRGSPCR